MDTGTFAHAGTALRSARSVVIAGHVDPDGDAIGSILGLAAALDLAGVATTAVLANGTGCPVTYAFLPGSDRFQAVADAPVPEVFVALDSPVLERLGDAEPLARAAQVLIAIDHHPDAALDCDICLVDPHAAATGALVWELLPHLGVAATPDIATCLYAALLSDTGRFSYSNTTPEALRAAAAMIEAGANPHAVYAAIYESRSPAAQALVARALERAAFTNAGRVAYSWIDTADFTQTGARPEEAENLIDQLRPLGGVAVVFFAKIDGPVVRVSLRAKEDVDVGAIARSFGGGGHRAAAGFTYAGGFDALLVELLPTLPGGRP